LGPAYFISLLAVCYHLGYPTAYAPKPELVYSVVERSDAVLDWPAQETEGRIDVNTADSKTLQQLYGIGPKLAEAIIAFREEHGAFFFNEDLIYVKGIGEKKLAGFADSIFFTREGE